MMWVKAKDPSKPERWTGTFQELRDYALEQRDITEVLYEEMDDLCQIVAEFLTGKITAEYGMEQVRQVVEEYAEPKLESLRETWNLRRQLKDNEVGWLFSVIDDLLASTDTTGEADD